jgi:poly(3-hydroxybutyrate) depolymerase
MKTNLVTAFLCLHLGVVLLAQTPAPQAGEQRGARGRGGGFTQATDPRVQNRTYRLVEANEDMPYSVFVSSKVSKDKKNPLIVTLHGLGAGPGVMMRGRALDLAEEGGYILVAPMGHNTGGWYGSPVMVGGRGGAPAAAGGTPAGRGATPAGSGRTAGPPNELSEKDVMNVLELMRKEFNVDERRTYLMGHSMGGAGTFHLGVKYASNWAAIAAMAPASFLMDPSMLAPVKDTMPVLVVVGDQDGLMATARQWVETIKELKMTHKYIEIPGANHGSVIDQGMPDVFAFFKEHARAAR